jgi:hypothetical protein
LQNTEEGYGILKMLAERRALLKWALATCALQRARADSRGLDLETGTHQGTTWDANARSLKLQHSLSGTWTSPVIPVIDSPQPTISWAERWTGPLRWEKYARNPVLTAADFDRGMLSTPCVLKHGDVLTLFYGSRPDVRLAFGSASDMSRWRRHPQAVLSAGPSDSFDAGGVNGPEVVALTDRHLRMYYVGYHPTWREGAMPVHQLGVAESEDGGYTWRRLSHLPAIARGPKGTYDGFSASSCSVLRVGSEWWMWYGGIAQVPYLASICLAKSLDGIHWTKFEGNPVLRFNPYYRSDALVVARPQVILDNGVFRMWYSAKGLNDSGSPGEYRICYAESLDGIEWERFGGNPVLRPSGTGWDQKMVEYAEVLRDSQGDHMWFCGDGYGSLGYAKGYAVTSAAVETRTGPVAAPDSRWSVWTAYRPGAAAHQSGSRYVQVRITLETSDAAISPAIQNLELRA